MRELLIALLFEIVAELLGDGAKRFSKWLAKCAATLLPREHRARWREDWCVDLETRPRLLRPLFALDLFRAAFFMRRDYRRIALAKLGRPTHSPTAPVAKRAFDIAFSSVLLVLFAPCLLLFAIMIPITSRGPVLFQQRRYAPGGREFVVHKFRTIAMMSDTTAAAESEVRYRITHVGRFMRRTSLDVMPMLLSVLTGDMSIIGRRSSRIAPTEERIKANALFDKPGLIEWENLVSLEEMADLRETKEWSMLFEIRVLFRVCGLVLRGK